MSYKGSSGGKTYLKGLEKVMANLNKEMGKLTGPKAVRGLIMAAAYIRRQTEHQTPLTPVDLGNLRASWFVATGRGSVSGGNRTMTKSFKGPQAGKISAAYQSAVTESAARAQAMSYAGKGVFVIFGYGANYAGYVHEMIGATFHKEGSGPKWFQQHLQMGSKMMITIVQKEMKINK